MEKKHIDLYHNCEKKCNLSFEEYDTLLIEFMDKLIDKLEKQKEFQSFYINNLFLQKYLEVKSENKQKLKNLLEEKKIYIDNDFILEDNFLENSENDEKNQYIKYYTEKFEDFTNNSSLGIYLKQLNIQCKMLLKNVAEPLSVMTYKKGKEYPHNLFNLAFKLLIQNYQQNSNFNCNDEKLYKEMVIRFEKVKSIARYIIDESLEYLKNNIDTNSFKKISEDAIPFMITNTNSDRRYGVFEAKIEVSKKYFEYENFENVLRELSETVLPKYKVVDSEGKELRAKVVELENNFSIGLSKDMLNKPYIAKRVKVILETEVDPFSLGFFALIPNEEPSIKIRYMLKEDNLIETPFYKITFNEDGSFNIFDKNSKKEWRNLGIFEEDILNSSKFVTTKGKNAKIEIIENEPYRLIVKVTHNIRTTNNENSSSEFTEQVVNVDYIFERTSSTIRAVVKFNDKLLKNRLRVLFETDLDTKYHYVDSILNVEKRDNIIEKPCQQFQQAFVNLHTDEYGITIANKGLHEYEIITEDNKNAIAITLYRSDEEFSNLNIKNEHKLEFAIIPHTSGRDLYKSFKFAYQYQIDYFTKTLDLQEGKIPQRYPILNARHLEVANSDLKLSADEKYIVSRWYNLAEEDAKLHIETEKEIKELDLLEQKEIKDLSKDIIFGKKEIITIGLKNN